jgi:hypothetical protein
MATRNLSNDLVPGKVRQSKHGATSLRAKQFLARITCYFFFSLHSEKPSPTRFVRDGFFCWHCCHLLLPAFFSFLIIMIARAQDILLKNSFLNDLRVPLI